MTNNDCPKLVATIGLHGSASTWLFNVVRELMVAVVGEDAVLPLFGEDITLLPNAAERAGRHLVVKCHSGSPQIDDWLAAEGARIILSVRDPRDAFISTYERFPITADSVINMLVCDCAQLIRLTADGHAIVRYENRFFDDPRTVAEIADWLGVPVAPPVMTAIFDRYRAASVQSFVQTLTDLPTERQRMVRTVLADKKTFFLSGHIGDGRTGKWRDLPIDQQDELTRIFRPFVEQFGYPQ